MSRESGRKTKWVTGYPLGVGQVAPKPGEEAILALLVRMAHVVHGILVSPTPFVSLGAVSGKDPHAPALVVASQAGIH